MFFGCWLLVFSIFGNAAFSQNLDSQLINACKSNSFARVIVSLSKGANPNSQDENGATALMWAVYKSDLITIKTLVEEGADPALKGVIYLDTAKQSYYGNLIGIAAGEGNLQTLKYLIEDLETPYQERGFSPETGKRDGWTAVEWAFLKSKQEVSQYLKTLGGDVLSDKKRTLETFKRDYGSKSSQYKKAVTDIAQAAQWLGNNDLSEQYYRDAVGLCSTETRPDRKND